MSVLPLTIGLNPSPYTQALLDGSVRESGHPEAFDYPGFRVALAIASLPGMTIELCNELLRHHTGLIDPRLSASCSRE